MRALDTINLYYERLLNDYCHLNQENSPCHGSENVSIIVNKKRWKKRKKHNAFEHAQHPATDFHLSRFSKYTKQGSVTKPSSMPELNKCTRPISPRNRSGYGKDTKQNKYQQSPFQSKFIANAVSEHRFDSFFMNRYSYPSQTKWKIYRCQLGAVEDSCCCSCNSDAMFEVMKSLYNCYKAQNCDNCCCVLCSHKLQEERKLGEFKKSVAPIARDKVLDVKTAADKDNILHEMAKSRLPLLEGKTASENALIDKTRKQLGLPQSPKNTTEKANIRNAYAADIIARLEGKTPAEKENILKGLHDLGIPLPEGRTPSENSHVAQMAAGSRYSLRVVPTILAPSKQMSREKAEGLLTPLRGKTPEQKEQNLGALTNRGVPLPEAQSPSVAAPSSSDMSYSTRLYRIQSENIHAPSSIAQYQGRASKLERILESLRAFQSSDDVYRRPTSKPNSASSYETIFIMKNDMSLSTSTSNSMDSISMISGIDSSNSSSSAQYSGYESTNDLLSITSLDGPTTSEQSSDIESSDGVRHSNNTTPNDSLSSSSSSLEDKDSITQQNTKLFIDDAIDDPAIFGERNVIRNIGAVVPQQYTILRMSQLDANFGNKNMGKWKENSETKDPIVLFNQLPSKLDVSRIMVKIMSKKRFAGASSIFIVVPMSDDDEEQGSSDCMDSVTSIPSSDCHFTVNTASPVDLDPALKTSSFTKRDEQVCGKGKKFYMQEISSTNDTETMFQNKPLEVLRLVGMTKDAFCQISTHNAISYKMLEKADATTDRACGTYKDNYAANVISRQITPVFRKGNTFSWLRLCKITPESSSSDIPTCFYPSINPVTPNRSRQNGRSQQNQMTKSSSLCSCPPDDLKQEKTRSAKVQKPSVESMRHEGDTSPKKTGWFRSHKAASSEPVSDILPRSDFSSSPVPSYHRREHSHSQQHQTPESPWPCVCPPDDNIETRNPSPKPSDDKKAGKRSWFRQSSASETPSCFDPSLNPVSPKRAHQNDRSQQNQMTTSPSLCGCAPDDLKKERSRSAKVQKPSIESANLEGDAAPKKAGWFRSHKAASSEPVSDILPRSDFSSSPVHSYHRREHSHSQQHQTPESPWPCVCPPDDNIETRIPSPKPADAKKVGKLSWFRQSSASETPSCFDPSLNPVPPKRSHQNDRSQQNQMTTSPSLCGCAPDDLKKERSRSAKVQKPSIESANLEGDAAPKKAGWFRSHKAASSESVCDVPPCSDFSSSAVQSYSRRQHSRSQQHPTKESPWPCVCPPVDSEETRIPSVKPADVKKAGKSFSWFRQSPAYDPPPCFDDSFVEPPNYPRHHPKPPSLREFPDDFKEERTRSAKVQKPSVESIRDEPDTASKKAGKSFSWSRLCKRKASVVGDKPPRFEPSSCVCSPNDYEETWKPTAKVKKPSKESTRRRETALKVAGKSSSWSRLSKRKASVACDTTPYFDPSSSPVPSNRSRQRGHSQQNQTPASQSSCVCPPNDNEETRSRSAKVQKPSIESMSPEGDSASKKAGKSFSWSRLCKRKASVVCDIPPCFDPSSSPVPSNRPSQRDRIQQRQTPESPWLCVCTPNDYEETWKPTAKVKMPSIESTRHRDTAPKIAGKSFSQSRLYKRKTSVACDITPCLDRSFRPMPSNIPRQFGRNQQHQTPKSSCGCLSDYYEKTRYPSANVQTPSIEIIRREGGKKSGNSFSWSHLCKRKASVVCDIPPDLEPSSSPVPSYRPRPYGRSQQYQTPKSSCGCPSDYYEETRHPSAKIQTPSIESIRHEGGKKAGKSFSWSRLCKRKASVVCDIPPLFESSPSPVPSNRPSQRGRSQQHQAPKSSCGCPSEDYEETRYPSPKIQMPSIESIHHEGGKKAGKSFSWSRLCKRKASVVCDIPPRFEPSSSPVPSTRPSQRGRSQQHQTHESSCICPSDDFEERRFSSAKVQKPSIESIRHEGSKKAGKSFSWSRLCKRKASVVCDIPPRFEPSSSPVPSTRPSQRGRSQQHQTHESSCICPSDDFEERRFSSAKVQKPSIESIRHEGSKKAGKSFSWSRLCKRKASVVCDIPPRFEPSSTPVPSNRPSQRGRSQQHQTQESSCVCPSDDFEETRFSSAKVQKPSIESIRHEGSKKADSSWFRLPSMRKGSAVGGIPQCFDHSSSPVPHYPQHGHSLQTQTQSSLCGCTSGDLIKTRNPSAKVQKSSIGSTRHEGRTAPKKAGVGSDWFRIPCIRKISAKDFEKSEDSESPKDLESPKSSLLKKDKIKCGCKEDIPMSLKDVESPKSSKLNKDKIRCGCKEDKPMSPGHIESPKSSKLNKEKIRCGCKEDKPMSPRDIESPKSSELKKEKIRCGCKEDKPMSPGDTESPKSSKFKKDKIRCGCKEDKPISPKYLESPRSSKFKKDKIRCGCKEDKPMSPKDLESPESSKFKKHKIICTCEDDKPMHPTDIETLKTGKQKQGIILCTCDEEKLKLVLGLMCPCPEQSKTLVRPSEQINQQPSKLAEETIPVPQTLASSISKGDKSMSSKELERLEDLVGQTKLFTSIKKSISKIRETLKSQVRQQATSQPNDIMSPETSKQKKGESVCLCNDDKRMSPKDFVGSPKTSKKSGLFTNIKTSISKINETLQSQVGQHAASIPKDPSSHIDLKSPKSSKQKEGKAACECKEDKPLCLKKLKSPIDLKSSKTSKQKQEKAKCTCKEDTSMDSKKLESAKDPKSPKSSKQKVDKAACKCKEDKPLRLKELETPKDLKSPKSSKQKEGKVVCECQEDKLTSPKKLESAKDPTSPKSSQQKDVKAVCECKEDKPMRSKELESPKDLKSPKSSKQKEGKVVCDCQEDKLIGSKELESPKTSRQKEGNITCECKEDKTMSPKELESPKTSKQKGEETLCECKEDKPMSLKELEFHKDLKSPKTSKHREEKAACKCQEEKPMGSKALESPKTSKQKERNITCECKEDKTMSPKELETKISKQKEEKVLCECEENTLKKITCKCDTETEPDQPISRQKRCPPRLPPGKLGLPPLKTPEGYLYEGIGPSCKWLDTGEIKKLRSELTQSTSGFKACKRKKLDKSEIRVEKIDNIELDFGEAIRCFATMNPERFQQLMYEELENQREAEEKKIGEAKNLKKRMEKEKRKMEKSRKKAEKQAKNGTINKTTTTNEDNMPIFHETTEFSSESGKKFPQGFKFSIAVKGGPTGLAGVDCTDMPRNLFMVKRH